MHRVQDNIQKCYTEVQPLTTLNCLVFDLGCHCLINYLETSENLILLLLNSERMEFRKLIGMSKFESLQG